MHNLATTFAPLYKLLQKYQKWWRDAEQDNAYAEAKCLLTTSKILTHFDSDKPIVLACDASPYGIGTVLFHVVNGNKKQPIAYALCSLSTAKHKHSQLDKKPLQLFLVSLDFTS